MRRWLTLLLVLLLPLQGVAAAGPLRCPHERSAGAAVEPVQAQAERALAQAVHVAHLHGGPARAGSGHAGHGHADPGHGEPAHAGHAHDAGIDGDLAAGSDADCDHAGCGACCHAAGTLPATAARWSGPPVAVHGPAVRIDAAPDSPALDGLFRPPRVRVA